MKFFVWALLTFIGSFLSAAPFQVTEAKVEFLALATPGALKISGKQANASAVKTNIKIDNNQVTGSSTILMDTFSTGLGLRDKHMKENYLESSKFPESSFTYKKLTLPKDFTGENIPFEGTLKLHGIEKPVTGLIKADKRNSTLILDHVFKIKTSDFGISTPKYMGVVMGEEVEIKVMLEGNV
jgi:polyisoprenoid-binding protein YceI